MGSGKATLQSPSTAVAKTGQEAGGEGEHDCDGEASGALATGSGKAAWQSPSRASATAGQKTGDVGDDDTAGSAGSGDREH